MRPQRKSGILTHVSQTQSNKRLVHILLRSTRVLSSKSLGKITSSAVVSILGEAAEIPHIFSALCMMSRDIVRRMFIQY